MSVSAVKQTSKSDVPVAANAPAAPVPSLFKGTRNFGDFKKISTRDLVAPARGGGGGTGVHSISIVNNENGRRIAFSPTLHEDLGSPTVMQFTVDDEAVYFGSVIPGQTVKFRFTKKSPTTLYNAGLARFLTNEFNLSPYYKEKKGNEGVTSLNFRNVEILTEEHEGEEIKIARIVMEVEDQDE